MRRVLLILGIVLVAVIIFFVLASVFERSDAPAAKKGPAITLNYYRFNESPNFLLPQIQEYQKKNKNVKVVITNFTDMKEYEERIVNELAEGRGPDIFSMPNDWIYRHIKKISPLYSDMYTVENFRKTFVNVADRDLVRPDTNGTLAIYGIPFYVDSLATFYNKNHFEDRVPSRGRPAATWDEFVQDVYQLTKSTNNVIDVAGVALGRPDNILYGMDIFYAFMLQRHVQFYDKNNTIAVFANSQKTEGGAANAGADALAFYASFAQPSQKNYTWDSEIVSADDTSKEIGAFASGKVSMIFGYSSTYQKILDTLKDYSQNQKLGITQDVIRVAPFPQLFDPQTSTQKRETLASYFAETVSRTSQHPREAWDLVIALSSQANLATYYQNSHRPPSRRDMIETMKKDPVYGVFAEQSAYANSVPVYDSEKFFDIFSAAIIGVVDGNETASYALKKAQDIVSEILPKTGFLSPGPYVQQVEGKASPQKAAAK